MGDKTTENDGKEKKDRSQLECWNCKEKGHFSSKYPKKKDDKQNKDSQGFMNATWQEEHRIFCTMVELQEYIVNNAVNITQKLRKTSPVR
jgi:hypothetical protein